MLIPDYVFVLRQDPDHSDRNLIPFEIFTAATGRTAAISELKLHRYNLKEFRNHSPSRAMSRPAT